MILQWGIIRKENVGEKEFPFWNWTAWICMVMWCGMSLWSHIGYSVHSWWDIVCHRISRKKNGAIVVKESQVTERLRRKKIWNWSICKDEAASCSASYAQLLVTCRKREPLTQHNTTHSSKPNIQIKKVVLWLETKGSSYSSN